MNTKQDRFDNLSEEGKNSIEQGLDDIKNNKVISHEEVMMEAKKKIRTVQDNSKKLN